MNALLPDADDWPDPVELVNADGASRFVLVCEHASNHIPAGYEGLGLGADDLERHIAWDIGAAELTRRLAHLLDAPAFLGTYSRLLIDLNRPLDVDGSMPTRSETTDIPGNEALPLAERRRRQERIFAPFQARLSAHLDRRAAAGRPSVLIAVHSFTPVYQGISRPWHAGILFCRAEGLGRRLIQRLSAEPALTVAANQPYSIGRDEDYAVLVHGDDRGIPAVLIEIRNDGLADPGQIDAWADRLAAALRDEEARDHPHHQHRAQDRENELIPASS